jgi:excisionase family DNA binding protein
MKTNNTSKFISLKTLAVRWSLHPESVRRMAREGRIPFFRIGNIMRTSLEEVMAIEQSLYGKHLSPAHNNGYKSKSTIPVANQNVTKKSYC